MNILVNGIGNIGTTLLNLLADFREDLGIAEIFALKNTPQPYLEADLQILREKGIKILDRNSDFSGIHYVFDTTHEGARNKSWYESFPNLRAACAQGTEHAFGRSFMTGVNDAELREQKFAHIVSCNTHGIAALLQTFCGNDLQNLAAGDFVVVRRSEDVGQHARLVAANVVARHRDAEFGTHHAIDVRELYATRGLRPAVVSSDITTPSQMMHGVRFYLQFKNGIPDVDAAIAANPFVGRTNKFDSNRLFELGRRYGLQGRLYQHCIIVANNLLQSQNSLRGWAFVPQEGNTLLSTLAAFMLQTGGNYAAVLPAIREALIGRRDL